MRAITAASACIQGNALETLRARDASDMVFRDGRKDLYLSVLKLLEPKLRTGAVVVADNIQTFKKEVMPYLEYETVALSLRL